MRRAFAHRKARGKARLRLYAAATRTSVLRATKLTGLSPLACDPTAADIDTKGHPTIGIGYNLDNPGARAAIAAVGADYDSIRSGSTCLSDKQVMELFKPSYNSAVAGARRAVSSFDRLCCGVQKVMTDMDYNLGDGGFASFGTFISLINAGKWADASADGRNTAWCGQVGSRCSEDMDYVASGCGPGPSPPSPSPGPSPSGACCTCIAGGGGHACASRCTAQGSTCTSCVKNGGGKACGDRCGCAAAVNPTA